MSTVSAGSPNPHDKEPAERAVPWLALLLAFAALVMVVLIGPGLIGILFAVIAPPEPPVPPNVRLLSHSSEAHGVDTWTYGTEQDSCELVTFFRQQQGQCPIAPPRCSSGDEDQTRSGQADDLIAMCYGDVEFSIFAMRWRFEVPLRSTAGPLLRFDLSREVFWTGILPPLSR